MSDGPWPRPRRRDVGLSSDLTLYIDALDLARQLDGITASLLREELKPRLRALRLVREQSASVARSLVDELQLFGWLQAPATAAGQRGAARATHRGRAGGPGTGTGRPEGVPPPARGAHARDLRGAGVVRQPFVDD